MSNLNEDFDDAVDELSGIVEEPSVNADQPIPDPINLQNARTATPPPREEDLFGVGVIKNEVPNLNTTFTIIEDNVNQAKDYVSVAQPMLDAGVGKCTVCQEDVRVMDGIKSAIIKEDRLLGMYSRQRTRTMADETVKIVSQTIDKALHDITDASLALIESVQAKYKPVVQKIEEQSLEAAVAQSREIAEMISRIDFGGYRYIYKTLTIRKMMVRPTNSVYVEYIDNDNDLNDVVKAYMNVIELLKLNPDLESYVYNSASEKPAAGFKLGNAFYQVSKTLEATTLEPVLHKLTVEYGGRDYDSCVCFEDISHAVTGQGYRSHVKTLRDVLVVLLGQVQLIAETLKTSSASAEISAHEQLDNASRLNSALHEIVDQMTAIVTFLHDSWLLGSAVVRLYECLVKSMPVDEEVSREDYVDNVSTKVLSKPFPDTIDPTNPPEDKILSETPLTTSKSVSVASAVLSGSMGANGMSYGYAE